VKYLVEVLLTYGIFFTPVFYSASKLGKWGPVVLLNPVSPILEAINDVVVGRRPPDTTWLAYSAVWAVGGSVIAWTIFRKAESAFAEKI
jgi:ABC-type polysaccharide/polyol phosphate export permease